MRMALTKQKFTSYLKAADFRTLFIEEMGWNKVSTSFASIPTFYVNDNQYHLKTIAHRNGFQILVCQVSELPSNSICKKLDTKLRKAANDYICIFTIPGTEHQQWVAPIKVNEKRDIVIIEYTEAEKAQFLYEKIASISFNLDETTTIVDVKERIQSAFAINSEKITKDFYTGFSKQHKAFASFISGIDDQVATKDNKNKQWYTSVMLNRLMFCYFIQKKGFLDGDENYLRNKLYWVQQKKGANQFFNSFYKGFLIHLFHDGLNTPKHDEEFEDKYGRIPYLNGGMFDLHQIERDYTDIDIKDEAFESLFEFFDIWRWHLDSRVTASGKDINPDVLGYIFEQYINDRAQMGAYYTKEDITEYIGRNTIIPYLFDAVARQYPKAFTQDGEFWTFIRQSGDEFIYDAVKKGVHETIPENMSRGLATDVPSLLERRKLWNGLTPVAYGLPTEIWRETIERFQQYNDIKLKLQSGSISTFNDLITYNLNSPKIAYDFLSKTKDKKIIEVFYNELLKVTILDPTCGSGAFLFAALNLLEPLYEVCISRMEEYYTQDQNAFKDQILEIKNRYRSNIQYYIYKSIILRNLYGVDIMAEAVEIAKLRLFLKMVAVVEVNKRADNMGLDPLPDVDFNIRCGNTLVGYATEEQLIKDLNFDSSLDAMFANQELKEKLDSKLKDVADTYEIFRLEQFEKDVDVSTLREAKKSLNQELGLLNNLLNQHLFASFGHDYKMRYEDWKKDLQPFHWMAEFYLTMHGNGGFDVIIGNPPYVVWKQQELRRINQPDEVVEAGNLYSAIVFRCKQIIHSDASMGMIVPISYISTTQQRKVRYSLEKNHNTYYSSYDIRPDHLFDGAAQRLTIFIAAPNGNTSFIDKQLRWYTVYRPYLFNTIKYYNCLETENYLYRTNSIARNIILKIKQRKPYYCKTNQSYWISTTANNFIKATAKQPRYTTNGIPAVPSGWRQVCSSWGDVQGVIPIINSSLFYALWKMSSDGFNIPTGFTERIMPHLMDKDIPIKSYCQTLLAALEKESISHVRNQKTTGRTEIQLFHVKPVKPIIDEIDKELAKFYGFSEEELDYILNFDIKYRMGDELNED